MLPIRNPRRCRSSTHIRRSADGIPRNSSRRTGSSWGRNCTPRCPGWDPSEDTCSWFRRSGRLANRYPSCLGRRRWRVPAWAWGTSARDRRRHPRSRHPLRTPPRRPSLRLRRAFLRHQHPRRTCRRHPPRSLLASWIRLRCLPHPRQSTRNRLLLQRCPRLRRLGRLAVAPPLGRRPLRHHHSPSRRSPYRRSPYRRSRYRRTLRP